MRKQNLMNFISLNKKQSTPILALTAKEFELWLKKQNQTDKNWLKANAFAAKKGSIAFLPDAAGKIKLVLIGLANHKEFDFWAFGALPGKLPAGIYNIQNRFSFKQLELAALAWLLGCYRFNQYKQSEKVPEAKLFLPDSFNRKNLINLTEAIFWVRDLINLPAEEKDPKNLSLEAKQFVTQFRGRFIQVVGKELLRKKFAAIYTVGKGSAKGPRLLDITFGRKNLPLITLVGKGVCFDSGGLDIKSASGMLDMKNDMAGAAYALALARMILLAKLPVRLRIILPLVENLVSGTSYKPGDIITSYSGKTIEVNNTDAEGRLILADALALASKDKPKLLLTFATLTGAARIALGAEIIALFTDNEIAAKELLQFAKEEGDPMWRLPLYQPYRELLDSKFADMRNSAANSGLGGAITGALFLKDFVADNIDWLYFDLADNNLKSMPGRPEGGEAIGLRAIFAYLKKRFAKN